MVTSGGKYEGKVKVIIRLHPRMFEHILSDCFLTHSQSLGMVRVHTLMRELWLLAELTPPRFGSFPLPYASDGLFAAY